MTTENQSIRYWFALILSSILSVIVALAIIAFSWYLLWKFVLSRFGVIRALLQINTNDQQAPSSTKTRTSTSTSTSRRHQVRRE